MPKELNYQTKLVSEVFEDALAELFESSPSHEMFYSDLKDYVKREIWSSFSMPSTSGLGSSPDLKTKIISDFIIAIDFGALADHIESLTYEEM